MARISTDFVQKSLTFLRLVYKIIQLDDFSHWRVCDES